MADPVVVLDNTHLALQPGMPAQVMVKISSTSSIVEGFDLEVLGEPGRWATITPAQVQIYPGTDATAVVMFNPPSGNTAPSGVFGFAVMARSTADPNSSAVAEGRVEMAAVAGLQAKLVPVNSSGRWRGRHVVQFANWGNAPASLQVTAYDPDELLGFLLRPDRVDLPVGASAIVRMTVRARRPFMRGPVKRVPFQVIGEPIDEVGGPPPTNPYGNPARPVVDGALNQKPILSKTFVTLVALVLIAGLAGIAYAALHRPAPAKPPLGQSPPPKPRNFTAKAIGPDILQLAWATVPQVASYQVQVLDPADPTAVIDTIRDIDKGQNRKNIAGLPPKTKQCYQLVAVGAGNTFSPPSDPACATTLEAVETASPSGSPTGGESSSQPPTTEPPTTAPPTTLPPTTLPPTTPPPTTIDPTEVPTGAPTAPVVFPSGSIVLVANYWPVDLPGILGIALQRAAQLQAQGLNGQVLLSTDYVDLRVGEQAPFVKPTYLVVAGPFPTRDDAVAQCDTLHKVRNVSRRCLDLVLQRP